MLDVTRSSGNVFEDLGLEDAANLKIRSQLMIDLTAFVQEKFKTQGEAAKAMGVQQSLVSDLKRGKIDRFTIDKLVNMAARVGLNVRFSTQQAA